MESLEYRYVQVHVNKHTAHYRADGGVTIVVSAQDPACKNWLDTTGHKEGTMAFRWIGADRIVHPRCKVVKLADVAKALTE